LDYLSQITLSLAEVIDMGCKGFIPYKKEFTYQDKLYIRPWKIKKDQYALFYHNSKNELEYICFIFEEDTLKNVRFERLGDSDFDDIILYDNSWNSEYTQKMFNKMGIVY
jgi:hypothetical protein